ncbi:MAG: ATP-binding protein [Hyphomicrobium sp.]
MTKLVSLDGMRRWIAPSWSELADQRWFRWVASAALLSVPMAGIGLGWVRPQTALAATVAAVAGLVAGRRLGPSGWPGTPIVVGSQEPAVQQQENRILQSVIAILDLPALLIDRESRVTAHNLRARELFPTIGDGQSLFQVSRHPGLLETMNRARRGTATVIGEMTDHAPNGRRLLVTVSPLRSQPADLSPVEAVGRVSLLVQFRDLSEQDRLAQTRSDFIANASHELRTPLASLKGFIETLQGPASGDAAARTRFLAIMETQAARMARILDDLLSLSRIEMRAHLPPTELIEVAAVLQAVVQGLEPIAREAKITLRLLPGPEPCRIRGDEYELAQVFQNIIENAIKYGHPDGTVEVKTRFEAGRPGGPDRIAIAVTDDGVGIAEEHLPRLTERFYRVDKATSRERGGTGLGLAIVKHIVNRHRGQLSIASTLGVGSTFTLVFDAVPPDETDVRPRRISAPNDIDEILLSDFRD